MLRFRTSALLVLTVALGGCGVFRSSPETTNLHPAGKIVAGAPQNLPSAFPIPPDTSSDATYSVPGKNRYFYATTASPEELRTFYETSFATNGFKIRASRVLPSGTIAIEFERNARVGLITILAEAPAGVDPSLGLNGTYVDVVYDLVPPPLPRIPTTPGA